MKEGGRRQLVSVCEMQLCARVRMLGYQILMCVYLCVTEVGCLWGGTSDARPSYFNLELREEC